MKYNSESRDDRRTDALRELLIRRADTELMSDDPDMTVIDECNALLEALEQGAYQPDRRRMRQEQKRLKNEIRIRLAERRNAELQTDSDPGEYVSAEIVPMPAFRAWLGAAACVLFLLILPLSVMLLRGQNPGAAAMTSDVLSASDAVTETAPMLYDGTVMCLRGNIAAQYSDLASCMKYEEPQVYYPTLFPEGVVPMTVRIFDEEDGMALRLEFSDPRYLITVFCPSPLNIDPTDGEQPETDGYTVFPLTGASSEAVFYAYEKTGEDGYSLKLCLDNQSWYELKAPNAAAAQAMFFSMRSAESDHVHCWFSMVINVPVEGSRDQMERKVKKYCPICKERQDGIAAVVPDGEHNHNYCFVCEPYLSVTGEIKFEVVRQCSFCGDFDDDVPSHISGFDETDPDILADVIRMKEEEILWIITQRTSENLIEPDTEYEQSLAQSLDEARAACQEWIREAEARIAEQQAAEK